MPSDNADRIGHLIRFLGKKLKTARISSNSSTSDGQLFTWRARMSLGNLLFEAHSELKMEMARSAQGSASKGGAFGGQIDPSLKSFPGTDGGFGDNTASGVAGTSSILPIHPAPSSEPAIPTLPTTQPSPPEAFDADALMSTFEDFAFTGDPSFGME